VIRVGYVRDGAASAALAVLAAGLVSAAFDFVWELPAVFVPVIIVAALLTTNALTPTLLNAPPPPPAPPRRSRAGLTLAAATLLAGWASIIVCGWIVLTERELDRSDDAANRGDYRGAIAEAKDAVDLMPWAAAPRIDLGLAYQVAGDLTSARKALREGVERAEEDWRYWRALALVDLADGNLDDACREIARTRELNPRQSLVYQPVEGLECPGPEPKPPPVAE
jgi:tetratricopeptide (TPR) repeat protein